MCFNLALKPSRHNVLISCAFSPVEAVFYHENKLPECEVLLETRTGCTCGIRNSDRRNCKIIYFQLLSQYTETELHIAILIRILKNVFCSQIIIFIALTIHNLKVLLLSMLQTAAQNPKAGSKGLISSKI